MLADARAKTLFCHRRKRGHGWFSVHGNGALKWRKCPPAWRSRLPRPGGEPALPTAGLTLHRVLHDGWPDFWCGRALANSVTVWAGLRLISFIPMEEMEASRLRPSRDDRGLCESNRLNPPCNPPQSAVTTAAFCRPACSAHANLP